LIISYKVRKNNWPKVITSHPSSKISEKWIEECLPQEFKRKYTNKTSQVCNENLRNEFIDFSTS
jgi:hypothetical protein